MISRRKYLGFPECDFPGNIDVKQVDFSMSSQQFTGWGECQRGIVMVFASGRVFWNATAYKIGFGLCSHRTESVKRGRLFRGGGRRQEGIRIFGEVLSTIRRVEAFREYNDFCTCRCSFMYLFAGMGKVLRFVRACCDLVSFLEASSRDYPQGQLRRTNH